MLSLEFQMAIPVFIFAVQLLPLRLDGTLTDDYFAGRTCHGLSDRLPGRSDPQLLGSFKHPVERFEGTGSCNGRSSASLVPDSYIRQLMLDEWVVTVIHLSPRLINHRCSTIQGLNQLLS